MLNVEFPFSEDSRRWHAKQCPLIKLWNRHVDAKNAELDLVKHQKPKPNATKARKLMDRAAYSAIDRINTSTAYTKEGLVQAAIPIATKKYFFGNVHMALMIGPIVIENGVEE
jgi:hypothetical protein